ncbi:hypothetical protein SteCoe_16506 [Stentor coeruleus]|uniref:Uncharacterized protein n=1 Tax=Stentor coeruleus TaxID=5963 RepID=A0A1R2C139_9CILI|nr:hypothetical protein SteCoe_16506 [Stentor coeruleus]
MDVSDSNKLLKTFNLNKALELLSCNDDLCSIERTYSNSTACETSIQYSCTNSIFGETLINSLAPSYRQSILPGLMIDLETQGEKADNFNLAIGSQFGDTIENWTRIFKIFFFDKCSLDIKAHPEHTFKDLINSSLILYTSKNFFLPDGMAPQLYDLQSENGLIQNLEDKIHTSKANTFYLLRNTKKYLTLNVSYQNKSVYIELGLEENLLSLMEKINKSQSFSIVFDKENYIFSSKILVRGVESECDLCIDLQGKFLPSDSLKVVKKVFLDTPGEGKFINDKEYKIGLVDKNLYVEKKTLTIGSNALTIKKGQGCGKKSLINKLKMLVKKNKTLDIPFNDIVSVKRLERVNSIEITFKLKIKLKFIIIETESLEYSEHLFSLLNSLISIKRRTI